MKFDRAFLCRRARVAARLNSLSESFIILRLVPSLVSTVRLASRHSILLLLLLRNIAASNSVAGRCIVLCVLVIATAISHLIILLLLEIVSISTSIHIALLKCRRVVVTLVHIVTLADLVG